MGGYRASQRLLGVFLYFATSCHRAMRMRGASRAALAWAGERARRRRGVQRFQLLHRADVRHGPDCRARVDGLGADQFTRARQNGNIVETLARERAQVELEKGACVESGNVAWVLVSAALVLFMTPGLAFFYGGLVKAKSVISMMMMSFGAMGLIGVLWVLYGYAIAFPATDAGVTNVPWAIDFNELGLSGVLETPEGAAYPPLAFVAFQATFAIITVALVSGAIADRAKFGSWMVFAFLWSTIVYFPVASWVFNFGLAEDGSFSYGGWITKGMQDVFGVGAIDFAGGTAVHINAGAAALALALVLGKRVGFQKGAHAPHNPPFVLLGAGLLWFGWFGFNAGSALASGSRAGMAFAVTHIGAASAAVAWMLAEWVAKGKPSLLGIASGAIAGLVFNYTASSRLVFRAAPKG